MHTEQASVFVFARNLTTVRRRTNFDLGHKEQSTFLTMPKPVCDLTAWRQHSVGKKEHEEDMPLN